MGKQTIVVEENAYPVDTTLTETEEIWRFLGEYYKLFLKKKYTILIFCIVGGIAGYIYASTKKVKFTAEVKFTSDLDNSSSMGGYLGLAQQFGFISGGGNNNIFSGANLYEFMKTPSLIEKTLFSTDTIQGKPVLLFDYYLQSKKLREEWKEDDLSLATYSFNPDLSQTDYRRDSLLKSLDYAIVSSISINKSSQDVSFVSVKMIDEDSTLAKEFSEALVHTVTEYYTQVTTGKYAANVNMLQAKADSLSHNFSQRLTSIASAQDINVNPAKQVANVPIQRQRYNVEADNAIYQEVIKNLELAKMQLQKEKPFIQIIESPKYPLPVAGASRTMYFITGFVAGGFIIIVILIAIKEGARLNKKLKQFGSAA